LRTYQKFGVTDGDICRHRRVHDFPVTRLPALRVHEDAKRVEDEEELAVGKLHGAQGIDRVEREEPENLEGGVDFMK
jgi:hypothetical protein